MIDEEGFRHGVGIILVNDQRQLFLAKRIGKAAWQFPQGGMHENESPEDAMFRELREEIGLMKDDVRILACTRGWLRYRLPSRLVRKHTTPVCIGQKQKWFLLRLINNDERINLGATDDPEFDSWAWVSYWYPLTRVVSFKRRVYGLAMKEFSRIVLTGRFQNT
ncbi:MAG: RNA pyrophosphohydrolase [Gammaproteobacteria bacterium]|nr:RNA pyrophosphohydrolase [Gammaproteobacteria bacterium]